MIKASRLLWSKVISAGHTTNKATAMKPTTLRVVRSSTIRALESIVIGDDGLEAAKEAGEIVASISRLFETQGLLVRVYRKVPAS